MTQNGDIRVQTVLRMPPSDMFSLPPRTMEEVYGNSDISGKIGSLKREINLLLKHWLLRYKLYLSARENVCVCVCVCVYTNSPDCQIISVFSEKIIQETGTRKDNLRSKGRSVANTDRGC